MRLGAILSKVQNVGRPKARLHPFAVRGSHRRANVVDHSDRAVLGGDGCRCLAAGCRPHVDEGGRYKSAHALDDFRARWSLVTCWRKADDQSVFDAHIEVRSIAVAIQDDIVQYNCDWLDGDAAIGRGGSYRRQA